MLSSNGFDSLVDSSRVFVYPNPASNYLKISSDQKVDRVEIYDPFGKESITSAYDTKINVSLLKKGIYFVKIYTGGEVVTRKLIKD